MSPSRLRYPNNARFAFSIMDDTDDATLANVKPVYDTLRLCGLRTTKTAWPLNCPEGSRLFFAAETLQHIPYLKFVHELVDDGFELAFHGATMESSPRERTIRALEYLKAEFGFYPRLFCNHGQNKENLHWGYRRLQTPGLRQLFRLFQKEPTNHYEGEVEKSDYFWGDLCKTHIQYVRNFTFHRLNMLEVNPEMPYRHPATKYVNYWFSTADAPDVHAFTRLLTNDRINRLESDGGICIVSTHFGKGFSSQGRVDPGVARLFDHLAQRPAWFAPVSEILDFLRQNRTSDLPLSPSRLCLIELRFLIDKFKDLTRRR